MANNIGAIEINIAENFDLNQPKIINLQPLALSEDESKSIEYLNEFDGVTSDSFGSEVDMSSNSGLFDTNPLSNSSENSPKLGISANIKRDEIINISILQREGKTVFVLLTFPTQATIKSITGITNDSSNSLIEYQVASPYGLTSGAPFNSQTKFLPGDYCIGLVFSAIEEANKIVSIKFNISLEPISNLMLSQIVFGLYRSLGFEPSHVLKYPVQSVNSGAPFYRKTRGEIGKAVDTITQLSNKIIEQNGQLSTKMDNFPHNKVSEIASIVSNTAVLVNSLDSQITNIGTLTGEVNSKVGKLNDISSEISNLGPRVDKVFNLNVQMSELITKVDKVTEMVNPLANIQEKLKEMNKNLSKENSSDVLIKQVEEIQSQITQLQDQLDIVIERNDNISNSDDDVEKGIRDIQSITISDFEKLINERDLYFNKLLEAEDHIDYLQEEIEEAEKRKQKQPTVHEKRIKSQWT